MACFVELLRCDQCGREVERHMIQVVRDDKGERHFLCDECTGEPPAPPAPAPPPCD